MKEKGLYRRAWEQFLQEIEKKTTWGKNELKQLMLECLISPKEDE